VAVYENTRFDFDDHLPFAEAKFTADEVSGGLLDETNLNDLQSLNDKLMQAEDEFKTNRGRMFRAGSMVV